MPTRAGRAACLLLATALSARAAAGGDVPPELAKRINAAIDRGAAWLASKWNEDGSFPGIDRAGAAQYTIGTTALAGLALLAAETPPRTDPRWKTCLELLHKLDGGQSGGGVRNTYDTSVLILFLTEFHRVAPKDAPKGTSAKVNPCGLPEDVRAWVQALATAVEGMQLESGGWRYPQHPPADVSNTQYAVLGLRAAKECGATVRALTFLRALEWGLALQHQDGPKVKRTEPTKPGEREYVIEAGDRARGWPYQKAADTPTGSTTTAGLSVLVAANDALVKPTRFSGYAEEIQRRVRRSVQDGFAWLDSNFAVDRNPPIGPAWHHSYLFGLERCCILAGREHVGKHDWYRLGAEHLVSSQQEDGKWSRGALGHSTGPSEVVDTAWALLFLKRAVRPATPIPAPVVTPGG